MSCDWESLTLIACTTCQDNNHHHQQCDNVPFWFPVLTWCQLRINKNSEWLLSELLRKQAEPWSKLGCVKTNMDCYLPKHETANVGNTYFQKEFSRIFPFGWRGHLSPNFALYSCFCAHFQMKKRRVICWKDGAVRWNIGKCTFTPAVVESKYVLHWERQCICISRVFENNFCFSFHSIELPNVKRYILQSTNETSKKPAPSCQNVILWGILVNMVMLQNC